MRWIKKFFLYIQQHNYSKIIPLKLCPPSCEYLNNSKFTREIIDKALKSFLFYPGTDKRFCNGIGGCSCILPCIKRYSFSSECWKCPSFNKTVSTDDVAKHIGYQKFTWDSKWSRKYLRVDAGKLIMIVVIQYRSI